ncbi:uncharacterized protein ACNLHF_006725 [Anomaloglossus baeobatrachus]
MQGGTVSFRATEKTQMGWLVDFTYKSSFIDNFGEQFFWYCNGDCGYEIDRWIEPVENKTWFPGRWFQYEGYIRRRVDNDKPFEFWENSCCWVYNIYNVGGWMLTASVDLGIRSDTQTPNSSPVTTTIPVLRIPQNCGSTINIFGHDPDGDHVSCRYGYYYGECSSCIWNFYIDERRCTLSVPSWSTTGSYVMELILEDFPKNNIYLMYNDGTRVYKYPKLNRKSREVPKDSQKYWYWYSTYTYGSDSTYYGDTSWTTESVTETGETSTVWPELTSGMHSTQDYYTSDYPDITTSVYEDFPLHTTYETVADTVTESVTESVTGASSTVMTPGMHSTQEYYTSDYPDITTSVYEDFPLHTTYETVADTVTESVTESVTGASSTVMTPGMHSTQEYYTSDYPDTTTSVYKDFPLHTTYETVADTVTESVTESVTGASSTVMTLGMHSTQDYYTSDYPDITTSVYEDFPLHTTYETVADTVTESVTESVTGASSTVMTPGMHSTQDYYTSDYPDITTSVYEDFPLHTTYETVADTVTESVTESVTRASSTVMTPGMHSTQEYYTSDYPDTTASVYEDFPLHTTYETVADTVTESVTESVTGASSTVMTPGMHSTQDYYTSDYPDITTSVYEDFPLHTTYETVANTVSESVTESVTGVSSTVMTPGMHSTQEYYTSDYPDITTSVYEDFPLHTTYETVADTVTESVTESVTGVSSTVMTPGMHSTQEYYTSDYPDITTSVYEDFPLHTTYETVADIVTESVTNYVTETSSPPEYTTHDWYYPTYQPPSLNSLSKISLQFLVEVTSSVPSCTIGLYIPKFVSPTPTHGEKLLMNAGRAVQLHLSAQAAYESVSDFLVSGPPGITKSFTSTSRSTTWNMVVEWTPSENHVGGHIPFCFVAETYGGYQSEMRCVIVVVGPNHLDNMELSCHENTMTLIVEKSADHELYENQFRLNDPQCLVSSNSTHLIASVAYNTCGTEIEETEDDIVFKNQATSFSDKVSVITREHGVAIPFNCSFPKETRVSASFRAHKSDYVFTEAGFGKFTYKFQFYTDDRFVDVETQYPLEATLRQLLYMEIQVSASVPNVQLFVESCKAAPHDNPSDPTFYHLIQNGCIRDETLVVYSENRTDFRFAVEAFAFIGDYSEVYISCTVILCKLGKPGTRCSQGCVTKSLGGANRQRYRRALTSESQQHFISQGPLRMKRQSPSDGDHEASASVNVNTLVISISGVAVAAALGVIVYLYAKRHRLSGYNLLKTQDF